MKPELVDHPYGAFLDRVNKPARYTGGEVGAVVKPWTDDVAKVCLAFPDVYDIGMSHLGFKILYKILNDDPRTLAERCYAPWVDMEKELRERGLPLVSLETHRPLRDFDIVGFSLQFELTYTNILGMLDLGGVPLRSDDRGEADPLVIAGGPTATHPEPLAPFIDAFVIGDGESKATEVALLWTRLRNEGVPRRERLHALAKLGAVYVPSLYETHVDPDTGLTIVDPSEGAPWPVQRALVDLKDYPFPADGPSGGPEAIFDRMSIEIARGCTEGCRFCQAGMIYRPVRERDPQEIVDTVIRAVKNSGQDEVSLTALSTADVSCISPLIKKIAEKLAPERVSMGVSSLRAYGLEPELLDQLKRVRATGLTFAPEAGTQRMRDVVNKNVTEEQLLETADRIFSRGWGKMKLYFMLGLPTETDEDIRGIAETGLRALETGKRAARGKAEVTVSVSTHVPKPHTPFQWCAMDTLDDVTRKQGMLRDAVRGRRGLSLKTHDADASVLEGIFARGDRPLADVLERAFRNGARFDSWDEQLQLPVWIEAFEHFQIDTKKYLGTLPVTARLPWDHIDVGLEEGFLAREYRKALKNRLSPPCGKAAGMFVHHTNVADASTDARRLVCYDCGVACDMTQMREERIQFLRSMNALTPPEPRAARASRRDEREAPATENSAAILGDSVPGDSVLGDAVLGDAVPGDSVLGDSLVAEPVISDARPAPVHAPTYRYRLRFEKVGRMALLGHLDLVRELQRVFRRVDLDVAYTKGFHPKPDMSFGPALSLGVMSLDEYVDVKLARPIDPARFDALLDEMTARAPSGLAFRGMTALIGKEPSVSRLVTGARYAIVFARQAIEPLRAAYGSDSAEGWLVDRCRDAMSKESIVRVRAVSPAPHGASGASLGKKVDVRSYLVTCALLGPIGFDAIRRAGLGGDLVGVEVDVRISDSGAAKASEIAAALLGADGDGAAPPHQAIRVELLGVRDRLAPVEQAPASAALAAPPA